MQDLRVIQKLGGLDSSGFCIVQARGTIKPVDDSPNETARQTQGEHGQREGDRIGGNLEGCFRCTIQSNRRKSTPCGVLYGER